MGTANVNNQAKESPPSVAVVSLNKMDSLVEKLHSTNTLNYADRVKLCTDTFIESRKASQESSNRYSKPEYSLPEDKWREFLKITDQDLNYQCEEVLTGFRNYLKNGEIPVPHGAMRIAILLRKMGEHGRESRFLGGWIKHFPSGLGATYGKLVGRGLKVGAISERPEPIEAVVRPAGDLEFRAILDDLKSSREKTTKAESPPEIKPQDNKDFRPSLIAKLWEIIMK